MSQAPAHTFQQLVQQGNELQKAGRLAAALEVYERCCLLQPTHAQLLAATGAIAARCGRGALAIQYLQRASALAPGNPNVHHDLSMAYRQTGDFANAHASIDRAIAADSTKPSYVALKAETSLMTGDTESAWSTLQRVLSQAGAAPAVATVYLRLAGRFNQREQAVAAARQALTAPGVSQFHRINLLFGIANQLDELGQYEEAFRAFDQANRTAAVPWDAATHSSLISTLINTWTPQAVAGLSPGDASTRQPVFIVGMPRSGTTLVEQMLASLPEVFGAGELNEISFIARELEPRPYSSMPFLSSPEPLRRADVPAIASRYLRQLDAHAPGRTRITDKLPTNFLNIGLIRTLVPSATIIHCRREAMDSCVSCFTQHFDGALRFAYDLSNLGKFYVDYERVMEHWKRLYPGAIHDVVYEEFVADPEPHARRLVEAVGLPWNDAALRFHENTRVARTASIDQVRKQLYTSSIGRYRRFEPWLEPLRTALAASHA